MPVYKLSVHVDETDTNKPLQIAHFPQILGSDSTKAAQAIKVGTIVNNLSGWMLCGYQAIDSD